MKHARRSLAEIRAIASKAVRGAGCPWGMAEEAGHAAYQLSAHGLPGAETVASLLRTPRACACSGGQDAALPLCGLRAMVALMDDPPEMDKELGAVAAPLLVAAAFLSGQTESWRIALDDDNLFCGPGGVQCDDDFAPPDVMDVSICPSDMSGAINAPSWGSRPVSGQAWQDLEDFAARTYVPETAASRASGAGPSE